MAVDLELLKQIGLKPDQASSGVKKNANDLAQQDFLKLMTTQLQAQDPLKPQDNGEFLGQMAQFGTVSGIDELNATMNQFSTAFLNGQSLQASSLVGRNVLTDLGSGFLSNEGKLDGLLELPFSASNVSVKISDNNGQLLRTLDLNTLPAGQSPFSWDGVTDSGATVPPGNYVIEATGLVGGRAESISVLAQSKVSSVSLGGADAILNLQGLGPLPFSQVRQIQ